MPAVRTIALAPKVLLQLDLEGHSRWMASKTSKPSAASARIEIAELLHSSLKKHRFDLVSWKGDGGVYHADPFASGSFDPAVKAACAAARAFSSWRSAHKDRSPLRIRVSLHWASDVYIHEVKGYWSSDHLNLFMKYEREIGLSGTIAVTHPFFEHLSEKTQQRFTLSRKRPLGTSPGEDLIKEVHYLPLEDEVQLNRSGRGGFFEWIALERKIPFDLADRTVGPTAFARGSIGDASFLFAAPLPDCPITMDLTLSAELSDVALSDDEQRRWQQLQQKELEQCRAQLREDGKKVSPVRIVRPLSDIPLAILEWRNESWSRARSFHRLLREKDQLWDRFAQDVLAIQENPLAFPGIACCHFVLRTAEAGTPSVLLCQRQIKGQEGTYHPGHWSLSFEEQLRPGESLNDCIGRGLNEELLGQEGSIGVTGKFLAAIVEKSILNLSFIVLVDVPFKLDAIAKHWQTAVDKDEHRQLATLVLDRETVTAIATGKTLSGPLRTKMRPSHPDVFATTDTWELHPTAPARAAVALWVQETTRGVAG